MAAQNQASNVDLFDLYFRRADVDRDGRISGSEAVSFFQASNLPKQVLAQIWMHADQNRIGFLGRAEFYNALKLVTVAQSNRELTPDIVKAALYGPAASKIPAPQINLSATNAPQLNSATVTSAPQAGATAPTLPQNPGPRGPQVPPNPSANLQFFPQENHLIRPTQTITGPAPRPTGAPLQGFSGGSFPPNSSVAPIGSPASLPPRPQPTLGMMPSVIPAKDLKPQVASGNGFPSDSVFGGDVFSATLSRPKQDDSAAKFSAGISAAAQPSTGLTGQLPLDSLQSSPGMQPVGGLPRQEQSLMKQNQQVPTQGASAFTSSGIPPAAANSASTQPQLPWPKITQSDVQKYTKVFVEVDKDRDGKITGEEARNLFLSWRLPREVLKQVWDLSDQDNDSMLSVREFCTALYLMERFREGRPLPAVLPNNIMSDLPTTGQPSARVAYGNVPWGSAPGLQQGLPPSGARKMAAGTRMGPAPVSGPQADVVVQPNPQKSRVPVLEKHLVDQLSKEEQNTLNSKFQEATEADNKVEELEKEISDSKEKIEFFRAKMQEIILYKSRCDNRFNEITERTSADKQEFDSLAKKYEEKCKQVGDVASKLTTEEATFRDIQEKKMELYQAIVKMEQGDSADDVLQVRADRIQSDLDELVKSLNGRCKKYGLAVKPLTLTELPFGWQPGIQEGAADWDEDWDKFEDEGFTFVKELTLDVKNVVAPPKPKAISVVKETVESPTAASSSLKTDVMSPKSPDTHERALQNGSAHNQSTEDSTRSPVDSPVARSEPESPSRDFSDSHFGKIADFDSSPHAKETFSDHGGTESIFSGDKNFDEPVWGTFDTNDDVDSVWGFNPSSTTKEVDQESHKEDYFFSSGGLDLGLNPIRTESSQANSSFQYKNTFNFDSVPSTPQYQSTFNFDSVPSTPQYKSTFNFDSVPSTPQYNSTFNFDSVPSTPQYNSTQSFNSRFGGEASEERSFDNFSRFDSFNSNYDTGFGQQQDTLARFDSMRSTRDFDAGHRRTFSSFDDSDPFGSTGPFRTSLDNQTPRKGSDNWSAF